MSRITRRKLRFVRMTATLWWETEGDWRIDGSVRGMFLLTHPHYRTTYHKSRRQAIREAKFTHRNEETVVHYEGRPDEKHWIGE